MDLYHDEGTQYKVSQQQKIAEVPQKAYCEQVWSCNGISNIKEKYTLTP